MEFNQHKIPFLTDKQTKKPDHSKSNSIAFNNSINKQPLDLLIKRLNKEKKSANILQQTVFQILL